jgi:hypothetical protein
MRTDFKGTATGIDFEYAEDLNRLADSWSKPTKQTNDSRCVHGWGFCNVCADEFREASRDIYDVSDMD